MKLKILQTVVILMIIAIMGVCLDVKKPVESAVIFNLKHAQNTCFHFYSSEVSKKFIIQNDYFDFRFRQASPHYCNCVFDEDTFQLYLLPGDTIEVFANLQALEKSLKIAGSPACNYLLNLQETENKGELKQQLNLLDTTINDKTKYHGFIAAEYNRILRNCAGQSLAQKPVAQHHADPRNYFSIYPDIHLKTSLHAML